MLWFRLVNGWWQGDKGSWYLQHLPGKAESSLDNQQELSICTVPEEHSLTGYLAIATHHSLGWCLRCGDNQGQHWRPQRWSGGGRKRMLPNESFWKEKRGIDLKEEECWGKSEGSYRRLQLLGTVECTFYSSWSGVFSLTTRLTARWTDLASIHIVNGCRLTCLAHHSCRMLMSWCHSIGTNPEDIVAEISWGQPRSIRGLSSSCSCDMHLVERSHTTKNNEQLANQLCGIRYEATKVCCEATELSMVYSRKLHERGTISSPSAIFVDCQKILHGFMLHHLACCDVVSWTSVMILGVDMNATIWIKT